MDLPVNLPPGQRRNQRGRSRGDRQGVTGAHRLRKRLLQRGGAVERPGTVVTEEGLALDDFQDGGFLLLADQQAARPSGQQRGAAHGCAAVDCQPIGHGHLNAPPGDVRDAFAR